jgi:hypothetical protein
MSSYVADRPDAATDNVALNRSNGKFNVDECAEQGSSGIIPSKPGPFKRTPVKTNSYSSMYLIPEPVRKSDIFFQFLYKLNHQATAEAQQ